MRFLKAEEFRRIDDYCIQKLNIPEIVLMENAAIKVVNNLDSTKNVIVIICGVGNNGGDGMAVARHLVALNKSVKVFLVGNMMKISKSCRANYNILVNIGIQTINITNLNEISKLQYELEKSEITIDALFGTGISRNVEGIYNSVIDAINEKSKYIVSIDVPSGLNSDNGIVMGNSVKSNKTITFQAYKEGFLNYEAETYTGKVVVQSIGIPECVIENICSRRFILDKNLIKRNLIKRNKYAHKGNFGRLLVFAGYRGYTGAAYLCTQAAVKSGVGLTTLCCPDNIVPILSSKLTEAMIVSNNDRSRIDTLISKCNAIAFGPGMGINEETNRALQYLFKQVKCPIVIDADGLNTLSYNLDLLNGKQIPVIVTPHVGEMARLCGLTIDYIKQNRIEVAEDFANRYEVIVLLKGYNTIITDGKTTMINPTGSSAMASGGMGDCLTGIIAAFLAAGQDALTAASCAAFVHGYVGDKLSKEMYSVSASEIVKKIPYAIKELEN